MKTLTFLVMLLFAVLPLLGQEKQDLDQFGEAYSHGPDLHSTNEVWRFNKTVEVGVLYVTTETTAGIVKNDASGKITGGNSISTEVQSVIDEYSYNSAEVYTRIEINNTIETRLADRFITPEAAISALQARDATFETELIHANGTVDFTAAQSLAGQDLTNIGKLGVGTAPVTYETTIYGAIPTLEIRSSSTSDADSAAWIRFMNSAPDATQGAWWIGYEDSRTFRIKSQYGANSFNWFNIQADGDVGIGTVTPNDKLQVYYGTTNNDGFIKLGNGISSSTATDGLDVGISANYGDAVIWNHEATNMYFGTSGVTRETISAAGDVSFTNNVTAPNFIGGLPGLTAEATTRGDADTGLQSNIQTISGYVTSEATTRGNADTNLQTNIQTISGYVTVEATARGNITNGTTAFTGATTFNTNIIVNESGNDSDTRFEADTDPNLLYLDGTGTGKVGIGTAAPAYTLDVSGTGYFSGVLYPAAGVDVIKSGTSNYIRNQVFTDNPNYSCDFAAWRAGGTSSAKTEIIANSYLWVADVRAWEGTNWRQPCAILSRATAVTANTSVTGQWLFYSGVNSGVISLTLEGNAFIAPGIYATTSAGAANVVVDSSGNMMRSTSDERKKTNIQPADNDFTKVLDLTVRKWIWKPGMIESGKIDRGLVAQEVAAVDPAYASYDSNEIADGIQWHRIEVDMLQIIKQQHIRIDRLEKDISELKLKLEAKGE